MRKLLLTILLTLVLSPGYTARPAFAMLDDGGGGGSEAVGGGAYYTNQTPTDIGRIANEDCPSGVDSHCFVGMVFNDTGLWAGRRAMGSPGDPASVKTSAVGFVAGGIDTLLRTRPASSVDYIAYMGSRLHVPGTPQTAYAAEAPGGRGFNSLAPVLKLWTAMRNLAYAVFAVMFIIVGLMIMFRVKIDPKTAANIQNSLPKIIIALILVTFSYAIAGFLIDVMYVSFGLLVALVGSVDPNYAKEANTLLSGSVFGFLQGQTWDAVGGAAEAINGIVAGFIGNSGALPEAVGKFGGGVAGMLAYLIIAIAILWALFRTWFSLLTSYAQIVLAVIVGPLLLMIDAIPGRNVFYLWLKILLSNLLAFPLVAVLLVFGRIITLSAQQSTGNGFVPPLIGAGSLPELASIVGIAIILTIPKAVDILQEILKSPPFKYGNEWMVGGIRPAGAAVGATFGRAKGEWYDKPRETASKKKAATFQAEEIARLTGGGAP